MENLEKLQSSIESVAKQRIEAHDLDLPGNIQGAIDRMCKAFGIEFKYHDWKSFTNAPEIKAIENAIIEIFQKKLADKIITDMLEKITPIEDLNDGEDYEDRDYGSNTHSINA